MNYLSEAIEYLNNYSNLKKSLENLGMDIREIKADLDVGQIGAIEYSDMPKGSSSQLPGDNIINKMYMLQVKQSEYKETRQVVERMELVLAKLPEDDAKILKAWYVEGLRGDEVYSYCNSSERNFFRQKKDALKVFAIQLHGINAIR